MKTQFFNNHKNINLYNNNNEIHKEDVSPLDLINSEKLHFEAMYVWKYANSSET